MDIYRVPVRLAKTSVGLGIHVPVLMVRAMRLKHGDLISITLEKCETVPSVASERADSGDKPVRKRGS